MGVQDILNQLVEPNDFKLSTWMAMGASLLLLGQNTLPSSYLISFLPLIYLAYRLLRTVVDTIGLRRISYTSVARGRWTAMLGSPECSGDLNNGSDGIVMFVLGARLNHPLGKLSPGAKEVGDVFQDMWHEAETNRQKWGYLGRTATLIDYSDSERTPTIWLTYWKSLKGLHEFSNCVAHRVGRNNYNAGKYPHIGIMHETYYAPKGCWETLYDDMPAWGLGFCKFQGGIRANASFPNHKGTAKIPLSNDEKSEHGSELGDTLRPVPEKSSMFARMGREWLKDPEVAV